MNPLMILISSHPNLMTIILLGPYATGFINGFIKFALRILPIPGWINIAKKQPRLAAGIRLLESYGISPVSVVQSVLDLFRNEASPGTEAAIKAMTVSASKPMIAPPGLLAAKEQMLANSVPPKANNGNP
jgi:hypothetical protein